MNQIARIKEIVDWRNENIQEETYATHLAFDSIEQVIDSEETEIVGDKRNKVKRCNSPLAIQLA